MALLDFKAEVESLPQDCNMTWKLKLNPYPSALAMVGVQHGLTGFCNDFAMVGHAPPFFQLVSMVGDGLPSICFHSSVRHGLPLFSMAGEPLAISIEVQWNLS